MWLLFIFVMLIGFIIVNVALHKMYRKREDELKMAAHSEYNEQFNPNEIVYSISGMYGQLKHYIEVDTQRKLWRINRYWTYSSGKPLAILGSPIYKFSDLRDFELLEKVGATTISAGATSTTIGPPINTILGTTQRTYSNIYGRMNESSTSIIRISFKNLSVRDESISFPHVQKGSSEYNRDFDNVQKCLSLLRKIKAYNEENNPSENVSQNTERSPYIADELKKLKSLLDEEVITQEEFDLQKSKLL